MTCDPTEGTDRTTRSCRENANPCQGRPVLLSLALWGTFALADVAAELGK